jgi:hypothetical protein
MTAWQCGGQGFESPQLHPLRAARGRIVFVNAAPGLHGVPRVVGLRGEQGRADRKVRGDLGIPYDPALCVSPETLAVVVCNILDAPPDLDVTDVALQPPPA